MLGGLAKFGKECNAACARQIGIEMAAFGKEAGGKEVFDKQACGSGCKTP